MMFDEETLIESAQMLSPPSTSTMTFTNGMSPFGKKRGRRAFRLADVVAELKENEAHHAAMGEPAGYEEHEPPSVDERQQRAGAELLYSFERRIETLDKQLRDFENASRELGSSVGIVWSAFRLQERLAKILFLFRENAAYLYPRRILRKPQGVLVNPNVMERRQDWRNRATVPLAQDNLELDMLPDQLGNLAGDVEAFISCLNEFDEFNDEAISQSMRAFENDLRYFAACLYEYRNQSRSSAVQRYVHDLTIEIGGHLDEITSALTIFIEIGIPTIWFHQQHAAKNLMNVSTLSIVFGVVDALLLALSSHRTGSVLADNVNMFWMSSLLFSIAGGVNGLLGLTWKQSIYRSPTHRVPWWLLVWMKGSPLVFLVIAIACFSAGVVLFTYSSNQNPITSAVIVVTTLIASSGLICISGWFILERWTFLRQKEQKWLEEVITETLDQLAEVGIVRAYRFALRWCKTRLAAMHASLGQFLASLAVSLSSKDGAATTTTTTGGGADAPVDALHDKRRDTHLLLDVPDPRVRFQNAVRAVIKLQRTTGKRPTPARPGLPRRDSWWQTSMSVGGVGVGAGAGAGAGAGIGRGGPEALASPVPEPGVYALRGARVAKVIEELKALTLTQALFPHQALVRHIQFSPNGRYLATASWDRTAMIFRVGETLIHHRTLVHVRGFVSQVAWSPNGRLLVTRFTRGLKLWSEDGVCKQTIDRSKTVSSVVWLPNGQGILSVEGSDVVKLDLHGKVTDIYHFDHVRLINVAVTCDSSRLIATGPSVPPPNGPQPTRQTKLEKKMIVFNMHAKRKESQTPLFDDVRDIVISKRSPVVLVSFEQGPPQLWKLEIVRDKAARPHRGNPLTARLNLKHTFALTAPTSIAGSCYFGGHDEQFVFCVGKAGDVHIWDRETAALLRFIRPLHHSIETRDMTCVGWNEGMGEAGMMFASGSHDGTVRVWSTAMGRPEDEDDDDDEGCCTEVDSE